MQPTAQAVGGKWEVSKPRRDVRMDTDSCRPLVLCYISTAPKCTRENRSFAPRGLGVFHISHGLRGGLHSYAASRLATCRASRFFRQYRLMTQTPEGRPSAHSKPQSPISER